VLACPTTSRKHPTNQAGTRAEPTRQPDPERADFVGSTACPWWPGGMPRCPPSPGSKGRADRPARHQETSMRQFEQDWLELGRCVACSLHYQHPGTSDSSRQPRPSSGWRRRQRPGRRTATRSSSQLDQRCDDRTQIEGEQHGVPARSSPGYVSPGTVPLSADLQAGDADQHREQALDLAEGPGRGPAEGTVRPHSAPSLLERPFEKR
jgi:hypothetical protein